MFDFFVQTLQNLQERARAGFPVRSDEIPPPVPIPNDDGNIFYSAVLSWWCIELLVMHRAFAKPFIGVDHSVTCSLPLNNYSKAAVSSLILMILCHHTVG